MDRRQNDVFDLLPRGRLEGTVELLLDRATQPESKELLEEVLRVIKGMPAANAVIAEPARWNTDTWCTRCSAEKPDVRGHKIGNRFCHRCGAKMDGGSETS